MSPELIPVKFLYDSYKIPAFQREPYVEFCWAGVVIRSQSGEVLTRTHITARSVE
jgi:hypothetical protein